MQLHFGAEPFIFLSSFEGFTTNETQSPSSTSLETEVSRRKLCYRQPMSRVNSHFYRIAEVVLHSRNPIALKDNFLLWCRERRITLVSCSVLVSPRVLSWVRFIPFLNTYYTIVHLLMGVLKLHPSEAQASHNINF